MRSPDPGRARHNPASIELELCASDPAAEQRREQVTYAEVRLAFAAGSLAA